MDKIIRGKKIYNGNKNTLYETNNPFIIEIESTDRISAVVSNTLFKLFANSGIPTHYIRDGNNESSTFVRKANMINLKAIGRFVAAGSFCKRYGVKFGKIFDDMTYELRYKNASLNNPFISPSNAAYGLSLVDYYDLLIIEDLTYQIGDIAKDFFDELNLTLVDFKLEFGYDCETKELILCDEFSPDTCKLWDKDGKLLENSFFINGEGNLDKAYQKILDQLD